MQKVSEKKLRLETGTHRVLPIGGCLIEALTLDLLQKSPAELQQTTVLLPTRRLQLHLAATLSYAKGGATWLPKLQSWEQFLCDWISSNKNSTEQLDLPSKNLVMVSDVAELYLTAWINKQDHTFFRGHQAHELLHLLQELWRHGKINTAEGLIASWVERQWQI
ncbi:MAG: hypothetical protein NTV34_04435, partial [Proteobacteria bacterium]|nr:hypothetical protein [Pseudomonadota bacterium]